MKANIVEVIQKNLEYPELQKIDPNIQETKDNYIQSPVEKLAQAAIPAVLAGLYRLSRTAEGAAVLLQPPKTNWLPDLFGDKKDGAVQKVAGYAGTDTAETRSQMENIATEAIRILRKDTGEDATPEKVKKYMSDHRHNILVYLPAAMAIGGMLDDEALDDRTNKMEGPVSNMVHKIEDKLSGGGGT